MVTGVLTTTETIDTIIPMAQEMTSITSAEKGIRVAPDRREAQEREVDAVMGVAMGAVDFATTSLSRFPLKFFSCLFSLKIEMGVLFYS